MTERPPSDNSSAPKVFDRSVVRRRRARSDLRQFGFLHQRVAEEISDRLLAIERQFECGLVIGARGGQFASSPAAQAIPKLVTSDLVAASGISLVCDEEYLPITAESLDLVVAEPGLHTVNDLPGALTQIRLALKPDGLFVGVLFGAGTLKELREALTEAEIETTGGLSPRVAPFVDVRDGGHLLQRAGFALPVSDTDELTVRYGNFFDLLHDLRGMGEANALTERRGVPLRRDTLLRAAEIYAENFSDKDGKLRATFELIYLAGWAPHESQQQPLRPGTAKARLADALGASELPAGDAAPTPKD